MHAVSAPLRIAFVVAERGLDGTRLVALDDGGDRQAELIAPADHPRGAQAAATRETNPAVSPDGRWLVFASGRDRAAGLTSLWIAPLEPDAIATLLGGELGRADTTVAASVVETQPAWTADGRAIVFASTADGGDFDLWRVPVAGGRAIGPAVQITHGDGHEITPTVAPDGAIAYSAVAAGTTADAPTTSHLELLAPDGTVTHLTEGPSDVSPAFSPDGSQLAFARPVPRGAAVDADLWLMPRAGGEPVAVADVPLTDESGPTWSRDGRFLFATSVLRGEGGHVLFSSVVHVDLRESPRRVRILRDRVRAFVRLTPAVVARTLGVAALHADAEYLPELGRIMATAIAEQTQALPPPPPPSPPPPPPPPGDRR